MKNNKKQERYVSNIIPIIIFVFAIIGMTFTTIHAWKFAMRAVNAYAYVYELIESRETYPLDVLKNKVDIKLLENRIKRLEEVK